MASLSFFISNERTYFYQPSLGVGLDTGHGFACIVAEDRTRNVIGCHAVVPKKEFKVIHLIWRPMKAVDFLIHEGY